MSTWFLWILTLLLHGICLQLAVRTVGVAKADNGFGRAVSVVLGLRVAKAILTWIPLAGWPVYAVVWCATIAACYRTEIGKTFAASGLHIVLKTVVSLVLWMVGWSTFSVLGVL
jgi:hypothetical protein